MTASLAKGQGSLSNFMYLGGNNFDLLDKWNLSVIRFKYADPDSDTDTNQLSILSYDTTDDCSGQDDRGYTEGKYAPYISHMHYQYLNSKHWLFGGTIGNNWDGNRSGFLTLIFFLQLDSSTGNAVGNSGDEYRVRELDTSTYHQESKIIGIRPTMEYDNDNYYLHIMFVKQRKLVYYLRVSPDDSNDGVMQLVSSN